MLEILDAVGAPSDCQNSCVCAGESRYCRTSTYKIAVARHTVVFHLQRMTLDGLKSRVADGV